MAKTINFSLREAPGRQMTLYSGPAKAYSESTGNRETVPFTGPWDEALTKAQEAIAAAGIAQSVTCELECGEGGYTELKITKENFRKPSSDVIVDTEEEEPDDSGDDVGDSESNPTYTCSSSLVQVPILAHPKFESLAGDELRALKAMLDGQDENSLLDEDSSAGAAKVIKDCITSDAGKKAAAYISKGITIWNDISVEVTARWKGSSNKYTAGEIVSSVPGGFSAGAGRNWLCSGAGVEKNGSEKWCTASFRLSGPGGWDKYLYDA